MSNIFSLIEACNDGQPVDVAKIFENLIAERVAALIENEKPVVVREFYDSIQATNALTEDERFHKQTVGKDLGGGFKHVKGDRERSEGGHITYAVLSHDQMQKHGIPAHKKAGDYGTTVAIHHPKLGTFHAYQRDYDPVTKKHHVSVRGTKARNSAEQFPADSHVDHLAHHLMHS